MRAAKYPPWPPEPPFQLPPARTVVVPGRGEMFLRDTGGEGPTVMLLHGWMASADLNWGAAYADLVEAGYRVLAIDHRGHGRGLRPLGRFRLEDCAADAAGVLRTLELAPALVVGYSMGGAIAQLVARDHPDVVEGLILSGTAQHWQDPETRRVWRAMGVMGLWISLFPRASWRMGFKRVGIPENERTAWLQSEMQRHSASDLAEAGRELGRFDSRPWLKDVTAPVAVVVTTRDEAVSVPKQRELAAAASAEVFESPIRHIEIVTRAAEYNPALLAALHALAGRRTAAAA
jgi:3-oxoadipate enol-lactonase